MTPRSVPDGGAAEPLSPDDAFGLVGDPTRVAILRALWEATDPYASDNAVPFSALYDRVGATDTGNFNYHLGRLTDHFVRRTDDGYELTAPGFRVVRAVIAGGVTGDPRLGPVPVEATCRRCGAPAELSHEDGTTWLRCTDCEGYWPRRGGEIFGFGLPPRGLESREPDAVLAATIAYSVRRFETMCDGVCPACGGTVEASLAVCADHDPGEGVCVACGSRFLGVITAVCGACKFAWRSPAYAPVSHHPALVAFYYDHDVEHVPATWAAIARGLDWAERPAGTDPPAVRVVAECDGDRRGFLVDDAGTVVDVESAPGSR